VSLTMLDLNEQGQGGTYSAGPVAPLRKIWIGFALAFAFLVVEIFVAGAEKPRQVRLLLLAPAIVNWAYWLACVQRFHSILNQLSHVARAPAYPITPGQAVGYHFMPVYNLYWVFKWPLELSRFLRAHTSVRMVPGGLLGLAVFLSLIVRLVEGFIGFSLLFLIAFYISRKIRRAVDEYESLRNAAGVFA
jgi:hypothetical protein